MCMMCEGFSLDDTLAIDAARIAAARLIHEIAARILDGERFDAGDRFPSTAGVARFGTVHPVQYGLDTFGLWHALEAHGWLEVVDLEALQVFVPPNWLCPDHRDVEPDLADPEARVGMRSPRPNRAARRGRRRSG